MMKRVAILARGGWEPRWRCCSARRCARCSSGARRRRTRPSWPGTRENVRHLPGIRLPEGVEVTPNACDATGGANLIVVAIPSAFLRATLDGLSERIPPRIPVLSVVKGIENATFARPSQIVVETLGSAPVAVLSGPSHAEELARGLPASVVVGGSDEALNRAVRDALNHGLFRVYTNPDALGVELGGALKNILGIAAGICDGLGFGDNAKAALLTRGLVEITRFAVEPGGAAGDVRGPGGRRRPDHDLLQPIRPQPCRRRADRPGRAAGQPCSPGWSTSPKGSPPPGASTTRRRSAASRCRSRTRSNRSSSTASRPATR